MKKLWEVVSDKRIHIGIDFIGSLYFMGKSVSYITSSEIWYVSLSNVLFSLFFAYLTYRGIREEFYND